MKYFEVLIGMCLVIVFLILVPAGMRLNDGGDGLEKYSEMELSELASEIQQDRILTAEQYSVFVTLLTQCGYTGELEITEYYYESGIDGEEHQYSVSFDEICDVLLEQGAYKFRKNSYVYLYVPGYYPDSIIAGLLFGRSPIEESIYVR